MDKQKQIEDMAVVIAKYISSRDFEVKFITDPKSKAFPFSHTAGVAEDLYNAGYRKILEGSVVLTGTETEEYLEDLLIEFDEMSFYPATLMPNPDECVREWKEKLIYAIGQLRKETAEKFAERLKEAPYKYFTYDWVADEICKEITEGKV